MRHLSNTGLVCIPGDLGLGRSEAEDVALKGLIETVCWEDARGAPSPCPPGASRRRWSHIRGTDRGSAYANAVLAAFAARGLETPTDAAPLRHEAEADAFERQWAGSLLWLAIAEEAMLKSELVAA